MIERRLNAMGLKLHSPERLLTARDRDQLVATGGYVHHLFQPTEQNPAPPFPGEALLLYSGGLVEQTVGLPEGLIALVEMTDISFPTMAIPPISVHVEITFGVPVPTPSGTKVIWPMIWSLCSERGEHVRAHIKMLGSR